LRLDPLGQESAAEMLAALLGDGKDLIPLKRLIIERTEGTPFFMEEIVQVLFEDGVLQRNGSVKLGKSMNMVKVPATVQAVLASRIDRLPAGEKQLLQTLAVIGREFPVSLVRAVTKQSDDELDRMLNDLQLGEFIYERPAVGDIEYIFKHALTQEVAYNSILAERRRAIHEQTARAIEALYARQIEDHYSGLAHHYLRGNDAGKALRYAQLAAEQALSRAAYAEAAGMLDAALKLLDKLPDGGERLRAELELRNIESMVAMVSDGFSSEQRERAIRRMCELGEKIGEGDQLLRALSALSGLYFTQGESARGLELARQCVALSDAAQNDGLLVDARYNAGMLARSCGNFREAVSYLEDGLRQANRTNCSLSLQYGLLYSGALASTLAQALQSLGRVSEAVRVAEEALRHARESRHMFSLGAVLIVAGGQLSLDRRQPDIARVHCEEAIALSEENGFADWLLWGRFIRGWALFEFGQATEGLAEMEAGIAGFRRLGGVPRLQYLMALRAEGIARLGRIDEALSILRETLAHVDRSGEKGDYAEMLRLEGEVLLMRDRSATAEAEHCFRAALEVARPQEAKWWQLRTTVSLARLLRDTNRRDEARAMLGEIYHWFTEGFDTPDLKDAKALLDELNG
jgi:tetratricopeptide (TPR) repeat protein